MPLARVDLESLLHARKLGGTLTSARPTPPPEALAPTGVPALDARLGGGLARSQLSEIVGPVSSGRSSLMNHVLAAATTRAELVALVDTLDTFDPESAATLGTTWPFFFWIRGMSWGSGRQACGATVLDAAVGRALKAFNLVAQNGGFGVVVLDIASVPTRVLRRVPLTTWLRLQRAVAGSMTVGLIVASEPMTRGPGGVTIALTASGVWQGDSRRSRQLTDLDIVAHLGRAHAIAADGQPLRLHVGG